MSLVLVVHVAIFGWMVEGMITMACPKLCYCDGSTRRVVCNGLQEFPTTFDPNTTQLHIYDSGFSSLEKQNLDLLPELQLLEITNGSVTDVEPHAFDGTRMVTLKIRACPLSSVHQDTFSRLSQLTELDLSNDMIEVLNATMFAGLTNLGTLWLEGNSINAIQTGTFRGLSSLERLGLERNKLQSVKAGTFEGLDQLTLLRLSHNNITYVEDSSFVSVPSLRILFLDFNEISHLSDKAFDGLRGLTELNLAHNSLPHIPSGTFKDLPKLGQITLDNNLIEVIPPEAFKSLGHIRTIRLNNMTSLRSVGPRAFNDLSDLDTLQIEDNANLDTMANDAIPVNETPLLKYLYLSNNGFVDLNETVFSDKPDLEAADVDDNPLHCACALKWVRAIMDRSEDYPWVKRWQGGRQALTCATPENLEGRLIYDLWGEDLTCVLPRVLSVDRRNSRVGIGESTSFEALLHDGLPGTYWLTPNGEVIEPGDTITTPEGTMEVERAELTNHTVSTILTISNVTSGATGSYTLIGYNAAGNITVNFDLTVGATQSSRLSQVEWMAIIICGTLGLVAGVCLVFYDHSQRSKVTQSRRYERLVAEHMALCNELCDERRKTYESTLSQYRTDTADT